MKTIQKITKINNLFEREVIALAKRCPQLFVPGEGRVFPLPPELLPPSFELYAGKIDSLRLRIYMDGEENAVKFAKSPGPVIKGVYISISWNWRTATGYHFGVEYDHHSCGDVKLTTDSMYNFPSTKLRDLILLLRSIPDDIEAR